MRMNILIAALALSAAGGACALDIHLPPETATYKPSELPGYQLVQRNCMTCHAAQYASSQPPASPRAYWEATVKKMKKPFGAQFDDADTFTASRLDDEVADLLALIDRVRPTVVVGYDRLGSYGHPDHVRAHELAAVAAEAAGLPLVEVASDPDTDGFEWFDLSDRKQTVIQALRCYATQLTVVDDHIVHVGGQHQALPLRAGLRVKADRVIP